MTAVVIPLANIRIPSETELLDAANQAEAAHLHLITNGRETLLSPHVLPGWIKVVTKIKPGTPAEVRAAA
ncbi:MAG: hypothetical protein JNM76_14745 [Betaproteobacteria bacterium]|nr:hypothetical protein [Betaproteobacteria bacterium]